MRIAVLIKQIPAFEEMELGPDGRLRREGHDLEMNPYCRRAVAQAVELAATLPGDHECIVITLGPPAADDVLREALAWALDRGVAATGVHVTDPAFAGSDTLATARALTAAVVRVGPFDLVLTGRNSVDADTGQVGPQLAQLLGLPFLTGVKELRIDDDLVHARCEHDDGEVVAELRFPVVLSTAERLIDPCKVDPPGRARVPADRIRRITATELGPGPWGQAASPTWVGEVRTIASARAGEVLTGDPAAAAHAAVARLVARGAFASGPSGPAAAVATGRGATGPAVAVLVEPGRPHDTRELLGAAAMLANAIAGHAVALCSDPADAATPDRLAAWGADAVVAIAGVTTEEDIAAAVAVWAEAAPWAVLAPSTAWGREVAGRVAAAIGAGLTGDAVELDVRDGRLVAWKPAFGGQLVAAIHCESPTQMATVRVGVLPLLEPRAAGTPVVTELAGTPRSRVCVLARTRDDDLDVLAEATAVVGVGRGVDPADYPELDPLLAALGAELGATRKVTDNGWLPRARQIGITGRSIAPRLFVSIGSSGKFNHMVGVRAAGTVLAVNPDPDAPVFGVADVGIVGDWRTVAPHLVVAIAAATTGVPALPAE
ncbi:MAG: FAD-binding protein [Actinomycetota bacterium]